MINKETLMFPDLQASLLCDDVRQEKNGKFILIGIFDALAVAKLPAVYSKICVVNRWCCGKGDFKQTTRLIGPDGVSVIAAGKEVPIKLATEFQTATSIEIFMNTKFEQSGTHWIEISLETNLSIRYPLVIRLVEPNPQQPQ
jgi:hypothetical protein